MVVTTSLTSCGEAVAGTPGGGVCVACSALFAGGGDSGSFISRRRGAAADSKLACTTASLAGSFADNRMGMARHWTINPDVIEDHSRTEPDAACDAALRHPGVV